MLCEKDRVFPNPRGNKYLIKNLPADTQVIRLDGLGHIPMLEAPGRVTEVIVDFVEQYAEPKRQIPPAG